MASRRRLSHLLPPGHTQTVRDWLAEDCPSFDYGGFVVGEEPREAKLLGKSPVRHVRTGRKREVGLV
jgi:nicotinate-nucleotide pyrophosphorylase (carboxylating)